MHRLNDDAEVVRQHLAQYFVQLRRLGAGAERAAELALDHAERALDVGPLVVAAQELVPMRGVVVKEPPPEGAPGAVPSAAALLW